MWSSIDLDQKQDGKTPLRISVITKLMCESQLGFELTFECATLLVN